VRKSIAQPEAGADQPAPGASPKKITYVTQFDNNRFFGLYVDLLTRPVPITLP
jgi:hypothetical protein